MGHFVARESITQLFLVFWSVLHIDPTEFFLLTLFSIFWPFIYLLWINNVLKSDLVSVVYTAYTVYFLCFRSLWNISNLPISRRAILHGRTNENAFYWKFKGNSLLLRSLRSEIFFRTRSILRSRILGERQGNAKGTLIGTLQERVPCWFFC